jgi:cyclophilin family peptidyl-prolyl cis-trans isomerase
MIDFRENNYRKIKQNLLIFSLLLVGIQQGFSQGKKDFLVTIHTKYGDMNLVLFDKTPKHKANFLKLVNDKFYDSTLFHRVMQNFMIQGGDPNSKKAKPGELLGNGSVDYKIPAEILPDLFHKKGALAAARGDNPLKESSGCQFYIVQGKTWNEPDLEVQIKRSGRPFTDEQKQTYKTLGGSPHLDGNYTVFGQLISGIAVVDSIISVKKDQRNRPDIDIQMKITAKKMRKKKIIKKYLEKGIEFSF